MNETILEMKNITKVFPGTVALDKMNFDLRKGEVHAIIGENGAGKSTLMKILSGVFQKTSGDIWIDNQNVEIGSINNAQRLGISMIFQELVNLPKLTVAENLYLGKIPKAKSKVLVDFKKMHNLADDLLKHYNIDISSKEQLGKLTVAEKQFIEILKAINHEFRRIVIMDEPTSSLTNSETIALFKIVEQLKKDDISIIYISHRIDEVTEIADRISVFRDAKNRGTFERGNFNQKEIVNLMLGHEIMQSRQDKKNIGEIVFEVRNLNIDNKVKDFNMELRRGEILGIAGLMGSGKDELVKGLFGLRPTRSKELFFKGKKVQIKRPNDAIKYNIVYLPEERKTQSLFLSLSLTQNITPVWMVKSKPNEAKKIHEKPLADKYVKMLSIKAASTITRIESLSGGNQQKAVIARLLAVSPEIMILNDPTRGVDIGSKDEIYKIIRQLASQGTSLVLLSSELQEIALLSHRVMVLSKGETIGEFSDEEVSLKNIMTCTMRAKV